MNRRGAGERLARALCAAFEALGVEAECQSLSNRSWTSITFAGERHALRLIVAGERAGAAADDFLAGLADREVDLDGHLLVDLALVGEDRETGRRVVLDLDAITVEAW